MNTKLHAVADAKGWPIEVPNSYIRIFLSMFTNWLVGVCIFTRSCCISRAIINSITFHKIWQSCENLIKSYLQRYFYTTQLPDTHFYIETAIRARISS